jgi:hypothetical protein
MSIWQILRVYQYSDRIGCRLPATSLAVIIPFVAGFHLIAHHAGRGPFGTSPRFGLLFIVTVLWPLRG